jgi:hypothetical protein
MNLKVCLGNDRKIDENSNSVSFSVLEHEPLIKFTIKISTEEFAETEDGLTADLVFTFATKYPDEPPKFEIENENVSWNRFAFCNFHNVPCSLRMMF